MIKPNKLPGTLMHGNMAQVRHFENWPEVIASYSRCLALGDGRVRDRHMVGTRAILICQRRTQLAKRPREGNATQVITAPNELNSRCARFPLPRLAMIRCGRAARAESYGRSDMQTGAMTTGTQRTPSSRL